MVVDTLKRPATSTSQTVSDRIRAAKPALNEGVAERDRSATFPTDAWHTLASTGLFRIGIDKEFGGADLPLSEQLQVAELLGVESEDAGLNFSAATHLASTAFALSRFGTAAAKAAYLPEIASGDLIGSHAITEADVGSDALAMSATGSIDGDHIVLNGDKTFVTNGPVADLTVVYVRSRPNAGPLGLTAVAVPAETAGLERGAPLEKSALRTSPIGTLRLRNCRVPRANILGGTGAGFLVLDAVMAHEILVSFTMNIGEMQRRLDATIRRVRSRQQFGQPLASFQGVQDALVEMHIDIDTARLALAAAATEVATGARASARIAAAKILTSKANLSTAQKAIELHGGAGVLSASGVERGLRDAMGGPIYSGTNAIQRLKIAKSLGL